MSSDVDIIGESFSKPGIGYAGRMTADVATQTVFYYSNANRAMMSDRLTNGASTAKVSIRLCITVIS